VRRLAYRYQRTIGRAAPVHGFGFLTGAAVHLRFVPAPPGHGIVFLRTDLRAPPIPARVEQVTGTQRRTTLGKSPNQVTLVEHVLAALAGLRIDNCTVELDAPEPPGLDGSALAFLDALRCAGLSCQPARRAVWTVSTPLKLAQGGASVALYPSDDQLKISYVLDYGFPSPIGRQSRTQLVTPEAFANDIARCRTFILESEVAELREQGIGARITAADLLVFGHDGPIGNRTHYSDEPARHKILDLVGDLSLFGHDLRGHVVAYRSGHPLNVQLARGLSRRLAEREPGRCVAA
jgi:UDP-3-O-acyl N-acetylglucosamine deacetylase